MKIGLVRLMYSMFGFGDLFYFNRTTSETVKTAPGYTEEYIRSFPPDTFEAIVEPYSIAYTRQIFLRHYIPQEDKREALCNEYGFSDRVDFTLASNKEQKSIQKDYVGKSHILFEDERIEDQYNEFRFSYSKAYAILWCMERHYDWVEYD